MKYWSQQEYDILYQCLKEGMNFKACSSRLPGRTPRACSRKAQLCRWSAKKIFSKSAQPVGLRVTAEVYEKLSRAAREAGIGPGRMAVKLLEKALG